MTGKSLGSLDEALPRLRWGIIGTGVIASHFAEDIFAQHGSPATAVLSRDLARAKMFGARAGVLDDALCTDNFDKFAAAIDIAYIASPHTDHAKDALRCLRANLHVLVEKPLALTAQGGELIFARTFTHYLATQDILPHLSSTAPSHAVCMQRQIVKDRMRRE